VTYEEWYRQTLKRKIDIIDLYVADAIRHNESITFFFEEPVISDTKPEDYDSFHADRHFGRDLWNHFNQYCDRFALTVTGDGVTMTPSFSGDTKVFITDQRLALHPSWLTFC
jgi:hypothetical protein